MARVILNLVPVQSGGGQQQAFNLLKHLLGLDSENRKNWLILTGQHSHLHEFLEQQNGALNFIKVSNDYRTRFFFERYAAKKIVAQFNPDIIYHFTTAWPNCRVPQVVRTVYSNLYFPEIDFWPRKPLHRYIKKKLIDWLRLKGTLRADGLIFENRAMQQRAADLFSYPLERTCYIRPSRAEEGLDGADSSIGRSVLTGPLRILYLSNWYPNKNIQILPYVAQALKLRSLRAKFVLSLDSAMPPVRSCILNKANELGVSDYFELIGTVDPADVGKVISACDAMILLSKLECFSSNVTEAWTYKKPLVISDLAWAQSECLDAAVYVDRDSPEDIARAIASLFNEERRNELAIKGSQRLTAFNTIEGKALDQISYLEHIIELGKKD